MPALHLLLKNPSRQAAEDPCAQAWLASLAATAGYAQHCRNEIVMRSARARGRPPASTIGAVQQARTRQAMVATPGGGSRAEQPGARGRRAGRSSSPMTVFELSQVERRPAESLYDFVVRFHRTTEHAPHISDATLDRKSVV